MSRALFSALRQSPATTACSAASAPAAVVPAWSAWSEAEASGENHVMVRMASAQPVFIATSASSGSRIRPDQQDATGFLPPLLRRIVRDWLGLSLADRFEAGGIGAARSQVIEHRFRPAVGQREVVGIGPDAVRVSLDLRGRGRNVVHEADQALELRDRFGTKLGAVEVEQELQRLRERAAHHI